MQADGTTFLGFFERLFNVADFMPHGHCYFWRPEIVWLHVLSDFFIGLAYYSIPVMLLYFVRRRRDTPFHSLFLLFAAFIFWCGTTHFMNILTLWFPAYRLDGVIKSVTAIVSICTAIILFPNIPKALALKSPKDLETANLALEKEVAENKSIRQRLEISEEKFRLLVSGVKEYALILLDPSGTIVSWNEGAEKIYGYLSQEVIGRHVSLLYPPEEVRLEKLTAELQSALTTGTFEEVTERVRKDGSRLFANVVMTPIYRRDGTRFGFAKVVRDITEKKKLDEELREAHASLEARVRERSEDLLRINQELFRSNQELQQFAYVASHDLQEPLRTITVYLQLLEEESKAKLEPPALENLRFAVEGASQMSSLIDGLLAFSRLETRDSTIKRVNLGRALEKAVRNLEALVSRNGAVITHSDLPTVSADETQMVQLFQNLVGNAIKFRAQAVPEIHVGSWKEDMTWVLSVRDNGIGMEPRYLENIFEIFKRLHTKAQYAGTGIGLAVCKKIVSLHRGKIWAESALGKGSTFFFTLPAM